MEYSRAMHQFIAKLIIISLLFSSAEAAVCAVYVALDDGTNQVQVDEKQTDFGERYAEDSCNQMCHCTHHIGAFITNSALTLRSVTLVSFHFSDDYSSKESPPLYRPPII